MPTPIKRPNFVVLAARVLLLMAALGLVVAGFGLAFRRSASSEQAHGYACPMHPEVTASTAAECPVCKMELEPIDANEKRKAGARAEHAHAAAKAAPTSGYVCPMHPEVTRAAPDSCPICKMDLEPVAPAKAEAPPPSTVPAASSTIYAAGATWLPETFPPQLARPGERTALGATKRRVFVDDVRAAAWLEKPDRVAALLYRDELVGLTKGERGRFVRSSAPLTPIEVRRSEEEPSPWDASTSLVRFEIDPAAVQAGDVGWVEMPDESRELLVFPESALLRSAEGPYVLVPGKDGHEFERRRVEIGRILKGHVVVLSGLADGDQLVIGGAFFLDAERRLGSMSEPVAGVAP